MKMPGARTAVLAFVTLVVSISCGIEDYQYLSPAALVSSTLNSNAVIRLPDGSTVSIDFNNGQIPTIAIPGGMAFGRDYEIYYRIYLSDKLMDTVNTDAARQDANSTLAADWTAMDSYTVDSNNLSSGVASLFTNRKYYSLQRDASSYLIRSDGNGAFSPKPDNRRFTTSDDLFDPQNLTTSVNADVAAAASGVTPAYAYASMYVVMRDFNPQTLNPVYSSLAFVNIFLLPADTSLQNIPVTGITLTQVSAAPAAVKLKADVKPDNASNKTLDWSVSNSSIAGIRGLTDTNAIVYSRVAGPNNITVTAVTRDNNYTDTINVTLSGIAAENITLSPTMLTLSVSGTNTGNLTATVSPTAAVTWSSSDTSVATVSGGTVTAVAPGTAIITATTADGTELSKTCTVTVTN